MDVPELVADALGDEGVAATVPLKGEDALFVTRSRTLHYRSEGLISDESVDEYPHDVERIEIQEKRRKATIGLDYGTNGQASFSVPSNRLEDAIHPVLAGILNAAGVTDPGETVTRTFRFSELTLVVTSDRLVKHIGAAVWDREFEEVPYESVTGLTVEEGNVSSQLVIHTTERTERIKAPNEGFREVNESVRDALFAYFDVEDLASFEALMAEDEEEPAEPEAGDVSFDEAVEPIGAGGTGGENTNTRQQGTESTKEGAAEALEERGFTSAAEKVVSIDRDALRTELQAIETALEEQEAAIETQRKRIETIRELIPED